MDQLLVEIAAQPDQLILVAQVIGRDDLVELGGEGAIVELGGRIGRRTT